jgi:pyrroloquinoline quinone (PQQ) biosynthesis protein C
MSAARELVEKIRAELQPLEEKILRHRYLKALDTGRLARDKLRIFAGQQYHIIASDLRSIALLLSRHGNLPSRPYLRGVLEGENAAFEALLKFAHALGMSEEELCAAEPIPTSFAYSAFVAWLALYGSDAELAAAFVVNFAAWGANCGRMSTALKTHYSLAPDAVAFFDLFANLPPADTMALSVVQGGLDRGVASALIERVARLLQGYELMYWDSMAEAAGL